MLALNIRELKWRYGKSRKARALVVIWNSVIPLPLPEICSHR